jgi:hypothetical protein
MKRRLLISLLIGWLLGSIVTAGMSYHDSHSLRFNAETNAIIDKLEVPFFALPILAAMVVSGGGACGPSSFVAGYLVIALQWSLLGLVFFGVSLFYNWFHRGRVRLPRPSGIRMAGLCSIILVVAVLFAVFRKSESAANDNKIPAIAAAALGHPDEMEVYALEAPKAGTPPKTLGVLGASSVRRATTVTSVGQQRSVSDRLFAMVGAYKEGGPLPEGFSEDVAIRVKNSTGEYFFIPSLQFGHMKIVLKENGRPEEWAWVDLASSPGDRAALDSIGSMAGH